MDHLLSKETLDRFDGREDANSRDLRTASAPPTWAACLTPAPHGGSTQNPSRTRGSPQGRNSPGDGKFKTIHATAMTARGGPVFPRERVDRVCRCVRQCLARAAGCGAGPSFEDDLSPWPAVRSGLLSGILRPRRKPGGGGSLPGCSHCSLTIRCVWSRKQVFCKLCVSWHFSKYLHERGKPYGTGGFA